MDIHLHSNNGREYTYKEWTIQKRRGNGTCMSLQIGIASLVFLATMLVIFWRPRGLNEAWPASIGAVIILLAGIVSQSRYYGYHQ